MPRKFTVMDSVHIGLVTVLTVDLVVIAVIVAYELIWLG